MAKGNWETIHSELELPSPKPKLVLPFQTHIIVLYFCSLGIILSLVYKLLMFILNGYVYVL